MSAGPLIGWEFGKDLKPPKIDEYLGSQRYFMEKIILTHIKNIKK
jgi:hypothetical protein